MPRGRLPSPCALLCAPLPPFIGRPAARPSFLQWALELQARMDELFWDAEHGGYFSNAGDDPSIKMRLKVGGCGGVRSSRRRTRPPLAPPQASATCMLPQTV